MLKGILLDPYVIGFLGGLVALVIVRLVLNRLPQKAREIVYDIFTFIEDNYKEWGLYGNEKLGKFVELFVAKMKEELGKPPTPAEVGTAVKLVEKMVAEQKNSLTG